MRINNRPKEHYKLPKDTRFKGEQKSLTVRKGTIAEIRPTSCIWVRTQ